MSEPTKIVIKGVALDGPRSGPERGFTIKAFYLEEPAGDALVELYRDGQPYRRMLYPAYKVWNLAAHFSDIVDSEISGDFAGYSLAGWTGFDVVMPREIEAAQEGS